MIRTIRSSLTSLRGCSREDSGEVIVQEWFHPGSQDMRLQLTEIRIEGLLRDTMLSEDLRTRLEAREWTELDTMRIMREVNTIDVMLVSSSNEDDIVSLAAQIPTQKIWARVLGGAGWGSQDVRENAGENAEGIVFTTRMDRFAPTARRFIDTYRVARRDDPSLVTMLSYDAASIIIHAVSMGAKTRVQVRNALANMHNWPGVTGPVTFGEDGANTDAYIRIIRGGVVQAVTNWQHLVIPRNWGYSVPPPNLDAGAEDTEEGAEPQE